MRRARRGVALPPRRYVPPQKLRKAATVPSFCFYAASSWCLLFSFQRPNLSLRAAFVFGRGTGTARAQCEPSDGRYATQHAPPGQCLQASASGAGASRGGAAGKPHNLKVECGVLGRLPLERGWEWDEDFSRAATAWTSRAMPRHAPPRDVAVLTTSSQLFQDAVRLAATEFAPHAIFLQ